VDPLGASELAAEKGRTGVIEAGVIKPVYLESCRAAVATTTATPTAGVVVGAAVIFRGLFWG
jgi:hypothetical protein